MPLILRMINNSGIDFAALERVKNGEASYHLIEVKACRRGCIMGGGQNTRIAA